MAPEPHGGMLKGKNLIRLLVVLGIAIVMAFFLMPRARKFKNEPWNQPENSRRHKNGKQSGGGRKRARL